VVGGTGNKKYRKENRNVKLEWPYYYSMYSKSSSMLTLVHIADTIHQLRRLGVHYTTTFSFFVHFRVVPALQTFLALPLPFHHLDCIMLVFL
jgi:hypothetical protein